MQKWIAFVFLLLFAGYRSDRAGRPTATTAAANPLVDTVSHGFTHVALITIHPHDTRAFTEGLFIDGDSLFESTGLQQQSFIREYNLPSSSAEAGISQPLDVIQEFRFPASQFGEGITRIGDCLYALTYRAQEILKLSRETFELQGRFPFHTSTSEGWGLTTDGKLLIVSDGSANIQFYDPSANNFTLERSIQVHHNNESITNINELEYVNGEILANVWFQNHILRINATSGAVIEKIDLEWLRNMASNLQTPSILNSRWRNDAVMNGIAYNPKNRHIYLTGKLWDSIFEVEFSYLRHHRTNHVSQT